MTPLRSVGIARLVDDAIDQATVISSGAQVWTTAA